MVTVSNMLIMLGILFFFRPSYAADVDYLVQVLLYGKWAGAMPMDHIVFENIILGKILRNLVQLIPVLPWYTIFQYACCFAAISFTGLIITHRNDIFSGFCIALIVMTFLGFECYGSPVYLKTAAVLVFAGCFGIITQAGKEKPDKRYLITGAILIAIAGLITGYTLPYGIIMATIGFVAYLIYIIPKGKKLNNGINYRSVLISLATLFIAFLIVFAVETYDNHVYADDNIYVTTSIYRDDFEKIVSLGSEDFEFKNEMLVYVSEALYSHGALIPEMGYMYVRLKEITGVKLMLSPEEIVNFFNMGLGECLSRESVCILFFLIFILYRGCRGKDKSHLIRASIVVFIAVVTYIVLAFVFRLEYMLGFDWMFMILMLPSMLILLTGIKDAKPEDRREYLSYTVTVILLLIWIYSGVISTEVNTERGLGLRYDTIVNK